MTELHVSAEDINAMSSRYRVQFVNALSGFKSANLLGTCGPHGENLAIVSSVFHVGANPPLMGLLIRPNSVERHSLENLKATGLFTLNHVACDWVTKAHQTSARYLSGESEFKAVGLTPLTTSFGAPYVAESQLRIGLSVESVQQLTCNQTELVIGNVVEVHISDIAALREDGYISPEALGTATVSGLDTYHSTSELISLPYAKP